MVEQDLKNLIIERYSSLSKFAESIEMPWTTLDGVLKRGVNKANIKNLIKICNGLNIDCESLYYGRILPKQDLLNTTPLNSSEQDHIKKYRSLDSYGKRVINAALDIEFERCTADPDPIGYNHIIGFTDVINAKRFLDANSILYTAASNGAEMNDDEIIALANETYKNGSYRK